MLSEGREVIPKALRASRLLWRVSYEVKCLFEPDSFPKAADII